MALEVLCILLLDSAAAADSAKGYQILFRAVKGSETAARQQPLEAREWAKEASNCSFLWILEATTAQIKAPPNCQYFFGRDSRASQEIQVFLPLGNLRHSSQIFSLKKTSLNSSPQYLMSCCDQSGPADGANRQSYNSKNDPTVVFKFAVTIFFHLWSRTSKITTGHTFASQSWAQMSDSIRFFYPQSARGWSHQGFWNLHSQSHSLWE